jgi:hypothetical protein
MDSNSLIKESKEYISAKLLQSKKKIEMIYAATKEIPKKSSLLKTLEEIENDFRNLYRDRFYEKDLKKYEINVTDLSNYLENKNRSPADEFKILRNIIIERLNALSNNQEINCIWSYLSFFGREYLGLLSEQNLHLDYGHAFQRDRFFNSFNQTLRDIEKYGKIIVEIEAAESNNNREYKERLIRIQSQEYRDIIIKTGQFLQEIRAFIEDILESEKEGEKVLLEPDKVVEIDGESSSSIEGLTSREALLDLYQFNREFMDFLKIPDLKKIEDEE